MRTLAKATPKLLNDAHDSLIACDVAGAGAVKAKIAPAVKAASPKGLAYQAVLRAENRLRAWEPEKGKRPFRDLDLPSHMAGAISVAAFHAHERARKEGVRPKFSSERILVQAVGTVLAKDGDGFLLSLKLRSDGEGVVFAVGHSRGKHRETLEGMQSGVIPYRDCKLKRDRDDGKWYAFLAYEAPEREPPQPLDPARVLIVHRGIRNAVTCMSSDGDWKKFPGGKYLAQRRQLKARERKITAAERGDGAKGHGRRRRHQHRDAIGDKLARATHTFCQQVAAWVAKLALAWGCGTVLIEDYGGIEPDDDPVLRRVLDRFPLYELKQCIVSRLERDGIALKEAVIKKPIATTCPLPRCQVAHARSLDTRTNTFHCYKCTFERSADWIAAYWMGKISGVDMSAVDKRLAEAERELNRK